MRQSVLLLIGVAIGLAWAITNVVVVAGQRLGFELLSAAVFLSAGLVFLLDLASGSTPFLSSARESRRSLRA